MDSIIRRLVKVEARVVDRARRYFHAASDFPLARYYRIIFAGVASTRWGGNEAIDCADGGVS
jgi:hypothetical protein